MKELNKFRKFLSENALGVDKGDGTFEITPDIEIMGQKFNFSDICPSAHKLVKKLADENSDGPEVLNFAILHRDFFALEKKALGPQKITVDEYNNEVKRLYVNIINAADKLGVRSEAKEYMDMHIGKIKDAGFKASEPGGSSDRNFEEQLKEVRSRLESEVEGYTDLHENDVALEAFLGEEELGENDTPWKVTVTDEKTGEKSSFLYKDENDAIKYSRKVNDEHDGYSAVVNVMTENLEEGPYGSKTGYQVQYRTMNNKVASFDSKIFADEKEALDFAKSKEPDPSIMGVQVWEFYGPGEKRASGTQYLGGDKEVYRYSNPVIRKKDLELSPEEIDIKKFMGSPSFTHKRYGLSTDYKLMDKLRQFKEERKEFLASLD